MVRSAGNCLTFSFVYSSFLQFLILFFFVLLLPFPSFQSRVLSLHHVQCPQHRGGTARRPRIDLDRGPTISKFRPRTFLKTRSSRSTSASATRSTWSPSSSSPRPVTSTSAHVRERPHLHCHLIKTGRTALPRRE